MGIISYVYIFLMISGKDTNMYYTFMILTTLTYVPYFIIFTYYIKKKIGPEDNHLKWYPLLWSVLTIVNTVHMYIFDMLSGSDAILYLVYYYFNVTLSIIYDMTSK